MMELGTLSLSEYRIAALAFADRWRKFNSAFPPWSWVALPNQPSLYNDAGGYLALERVCLPGFGEESRDPCCADVEEPNCSDDDELADEATLVEISDGDGHYCDFHIIYSSSYRVPVLYFRVYNRDGQPLLSSEFEKYLPADSAEALQKSKWTFVTQEEHPYLRRPWYKLHPCGTAEWIKLLFLSDVSVAKKGVTIELYLVSWFSVVGQVVGLSLPCEMKYDNQL